jgi:hypothetical protein
MFELQYSEQDLLQGAAELKFDTKLLDRWEALMKAGHFRYDNRAIVECWALYCDHLDSIAL